MVVNNNTYNRFTTINGNDTNGGEDKQDKIFLLSLEEANCKYFGDSSAKLYNKGKNQRYWFERKVKTTISVVLIRTIYGGIGFGRRDVWVLRLCISGLMET